MNINFIRTSIYNHGSTQKTSAIRSPLIRKICITANGCRWMLSHLNYYTNTEKYFPRFELLLTRTCTFDCKCCIHFLPEYKTKAYEPAADIIADMSRLLPAVEHIDELMLTGGDSFTYPELDTVVEYLLQSPKIGKVVLVSTGTVLPDEKLQRLLPNKRIEVRIEDYGSYSDKVEELKSLLPSNVKISRYTRWEDFGDEACRNRTEAELTQQYDKCKKERYSLINGKIHACPRSGHGENLGYFTCKENEYIDLRKIQDKEEISRQIKALRSINYLTACNYCNSCTDSFKVYPMDDRFKDNGSIKK